MGGCAGRRGEGGWVQKKGVLRSVVFGVFVTVAVAGDRKRFGNKKEEEGAGGRVG